jgi:hypothetical protein
MPTSEHGRVRQTRSTPGAPHWRRIGASAKSTLALHVGADRQARLRMRRDFGSGVAKGRAALQKTEGDFAIDRHSLPASEGSNLSARPRAPVVLFHVRDAPITFPNDRRSRSVRRQICGNPSAAS